MLDFEDAKEKFWWCWKAFNGNDAKEKELTAYHEAGHALVGIFTPGNDPLQKLQLYQEAEH